MVFQLLVVRISLGFRLVVIHDDQSKVKHFHHEQHFFCSSFPHILFRFLKTLSLSSLLIRLKVLSFVTCLLKKFFSFQVSNFLLVSFVLKFIIFLGFFFQFSHIAFFYLVNLSLISHISRNTLMFSSF
jgi:hypothetical protein